MQVKYRVKKVFGADDIQEKYYPQYRWCFMWFDWITDDYHSVFFLAKEEAIAYITTLQNKIVRTTKTEDCVVWSNWYTEPDKGIIKIINELRLEGWIVLMASFLFLIYILVKNYVT